jgi:CspA family cold shock protein
VGDNFITLIAGLRDRSRVDAERQRRRVASAREGRADERPQTGQEPEVTMTGTIRTIRVDKGFGFIKDEAGQEYFFHRSAVYGEGLEDLREGDSVEFDVGQGPKGPRAENVRRTST